jgi:hypothetical protein
MHAREYKPWLGRFLTTDPKRASSSLRAPQSFNRYSYGLNNPLKYVDPDGKAPVAVLGAAWGLAELGLIAYDIYDTVGVLIDPEATTTRKAVAVGLTVVGAATIGGGYTRLGGRITGTITKFAEIGPLMRKLTNQFKALDASHATAAGREAADQVVKLKPSGQPFDHLREFNDARRGATQSLDSLKGMLGDPNLSDAERSFIEYLIRKYSKALDEAEEIFRRALAEASTP